MPSDLRNPLVAKIILVLTNAFLKLQLIIPFDFFQFKNDEFSNSFTFSGNVSIIALTNLPGCNKILL